MKATTSPAGSRHPGHWSRAVPTGRRALAIGALLLVVLTGCGDADDDSGGRTVAATTGGSAVATSQADHDEADVRFSMMMVPHHLQAVEMANLVTTRSTDPDLLALAARIAEAQSSEVAEMTGWLGEWGASPDEHLSDSEHMAGMEGMMT